MGRKSRREGASPRVASLERGESSDDRLRFLYHSPNDLSGRKNFVNRTDGLAGRVALSMLIDPHSRLVAAEVKGSFFMRHEELFGEFLQQRRVCVVALCRVVLYDAHGLARKGARDDGTVFACFENALAITGKGPSLEGGDDT